MAIFLSELCENNVTYLNLFLFDKNLFTDIRLLLINQLISKKFAIKFYSIDQIKQFFNQIQVKIKPFWFTKVVCFFSFRKVSIHKM